VVVVRLMKDGLLCLVWDYKAVRAATITCLFFFFFFFFFLFSTPLGIDVDKLRVNWHLPDT